MLAHNKQVIDKTVLHQLRELPPDARHEAFQFIQFLHEKHAVNRPHRGIKGLWANEGFTITDDDIEEVRRECWSNFPREDIL